MRHLAILLACPFAVACSGPTSATSAAEPAPAAERPPPAPVLAATPGPAGPVRLSALACGYGGSVTAVSVFVDIETDVALDGLTGSVTARDPAAPSAPPGVSREPTTLSLVPADHALTDFSSSGTTPFDGHLDAGAHARLLFFSGLAPVPGFAALEMTIALTDASGTVHTATCTSEGMWPSS